MFSNKTRKPSPLAAFLKDRRGGVAATFGLTAPTLIVLAGIGIDVGRNIAVRSNLQAGTDAAILVAAKAVRTGATMTSVGTQIQTYLTAATGDPNAKVVGTPTLSSDATTVCVDTQTTVQNNFGAFVNASSSTVGAHACTKFNLDTYEIALALDNSGSMANSSNSGQTKMQAAQTAATNLVNAMTPSGQPVLTSFSVVPFAAAVNIGSANASQSFMDTAGKSSIHWNNFQLPAGASWLPTSKFDLFNQMNVTWGGCVQERPAPYTTTDDAANASTPDTLFVPFLYPDENDSNSYSLNDYLSDSGGSCSTNDVYAQADKKYGSNDGQTKVCKYKGGHVAGGLSAFGSGFPLGPNLLCTTKALTPLTTKTSDVTAAINAMVASGDTDLLAGVMWGWRTISPSGPFNAQATNVSSGPQAAKAYGSAPNGLKNANGSYNHKVLILMTDGENHWGGQSGDSSAYGSDNNKSAYSALGFFWENRLGGASSPTTASNAYSQLGAATLQACTNAKNAGVTIYTVGFTASDGISTAGQALLQSCAGPAFNVAPLTGYSYIAADGTALVAAFQQIANQINRLHLSQ